MGNQVCSKSRTVIVGEPDKRSFPDNRIVSSKYTIWNFLPMNLYEQFRRFANTCFLGVTILTVLTPGPVSPVVYALPVTVIVTISAVKQAYEDYCRHYADNKINKTSVTVLRKNCQFEIACKNVCVGDIVLVSGEEDVPCDLVLLGSSQADGHCFVTTANLDGETNLKVRLCPAGLNLTASNLAHSSGVIECEQPTADLYTFTGTIQIEEQKRIKDFKSHQVNAGFEASQSIQSLPDLQQNFCCSTSIVQTFEFRSPLSAENLLLRGCRLKNTSYVYGCAVYTGKETKLSLNSRLSRNKFSTIESAINWFLGFFFSILLTESLLSTYMEWNFVREKESAMTYLGGGHNFNFLMSFLDYIVLYYYIIPTSMYVTFELQRMIGNNFFRWDSEMKCRGKTPLCNTSDLNEELGQIEYVFTDKTGTLTENEMRFECCSVGGKVYYENDGVVTLLSDRDHQDRRIVLEEFPTELERFLVAMAVCHTVHCNPDSKDARIPLYQASSADEKALVESAARCGVVFQGVQQGLMKIMVMDRIKTFKRVEVLEFSSERKRMSVIVTDEENESWLFCKGAESSLMQEIRGEFLEESLNHLHDFSSRGLRTLVFSCRKLDQDEVASMKTLLMNARFSTSQMQSEEKESFLNDVYSSIECNLELLGISAVEDKLQPLVAETLASLKLAGMKVWILTGDKVETAKSISYSCGHFEPSNDLLILMNPSSVENCLQQLEEIRTKITTDCRKCYALLVDGFTFTIINGEDHSRKLFVEVAMSCKSVVCCRLSPKQKAQIVKLIKSSPCHPTTLAIGDGANDVSMIQEAHIGIGIMGKEGHQAVNCSDFAFAEFQCLKKALLVHGHWYYIRAATLIQYFFYKNIVFITPQVYYACGMSPVVLYCSLFLLLYNTLFTFLPIMMYSLLEQDYCANILMTHPELYKINQNNKLMTWYNFALWVLFGIWHSLVVYFVPYYSLSIETTVDLATFGMTIVHNAILVVSLKLLLHSRYWTVLFVLSTLFSVLGFLIFSYIYSIFFRFFQIVDFDFLVMLDVPYTMYKSLWFWSVSVLSVILSLLPDITIYILSNLIC
ncbi:probable phospholipid-transporting ATPase IF isoform X2 [Nilaparvata lugens]|uniref:probable phospholipid-transporting ATPase IF isoform X2 n=1 Tax=Nilaparvata lugens TaxID=108931 RepID=UPI00193E5D8B|nr:probable phospholipid-transporting ATPase IF isoform X2 [Nilaparvata lugens]